MDVTRANTYTVRSWIKLWYEVYAEPRLREKTKDYYLNYIDKHTQPYEIGHTEIPRLQMGLHESVLECSRKSDINMLYNK